MNKNLERRMWQFPWSYGESITITLGILIVGTVLQLFLGSFDFFLLHFPSNLILGGVMVALTIGLSFLKKNPIVRWLSSVPLSVTLIGAVLIMTVLMGLIPQYARVDTDFHIHIGHSSFGDVVNYLFMRLGLKQVTTSWPFVLLYNFTLFVLGLITVNRMHRFKWKDYGFYLNHLGLWLFLFGAGYGSADLLRYVMYVNEGEVEWRVFDANENVLELDIAIKLHDFRMEEYPPKLAIIDKNTGDALPLSKPEFFQIDEKNRIGKLAGWDIEVKDYIHEAIRMTDTTYRSIAMSGSMPAVDVKFSNPETGELHEGWVTCGSASQYMRFLELDSIHALVMTTPEPKLFASDVTVILKEDDEDPVHVTLEVNKPLSLGDWTIYQYDYDHTMGKASQYSGFELVYDPWLKVTYLGIFMLALGAISMLWMGNKKNKK